MVAFAASAAAKIASADWVVIEHGVDHGGAPGRRIDDEIADRVGRLVEEGADFHLCAHIVLLMEWPLQIY